MNLTALGSKQPDLRWAPASTTKMMTGLLAVEAVDRGEISLDALVAMEPDVNIEGGDGFELVDEWDEPDYVSVKCRDPDGYIIETSWEPPPQR